MRFSSSVRVNLMSELETGKLGGHDGGGLRGQAFLGFAAPSRSRASDRPPRCPRVGIVGFGDAGDDVVEQGLVDLVAGEAGIADGLADGGEVIGRVRQRDAGAAAAEVAQRHDAAGR